MMLVLTYLRSSWWVLVAGSIKEAQERATKDLKESGEVKHWIVGVDKDQYSEGVFKAKDKDGKDVRGSATGKKVLPKTGSETSIFAIAAGFALILLSALVYRFKKAN